MDPDSGSASGMNTAYTLADCSRDRPTRERPGEKQDLAYVSAVPWERQIKESFVAYSQEQQLDSEWTLHLSPTEAAGPLTQCTRFCVLLSFLLLAPRL